MPAIAEAMTHPALRHMTDALAAGAGLQAERLAATADCSGAPENLWMSGTLDDAERDARSHQPGAVRDVALIGAVRKALAAQIVSGDTAIALAKRTGADAIGAALVANRADERDADVQFARRLEALTRP